jgi:hypothetical protein
VSEEVTLDHVESGGGVSTLVLTTVPAHSYELASLAIHANVARATHGESVDEVLGGGNAGAAFQRFTLRQPPLTYVRNEHAEGGAASTLGIRVNGLLWGEAPSFYGRGPTEREFVTHRDDEGSTAVPSATASTAPGCPPGRRTSGPRTGRGRARRQRGRPALHAAHQAARDQGGHQPRAGRRGRRPGAAGRRA